MRKILVCLGLVLMAWSVQAQSGDSLVSSILKNYSDSLESTFTFQHGEITFPENLGKITVPEGFKYLDSAQAHRVIHDLWGNPGGGETLGMIMPESMDVMSAWAFIITYDEMGHVKDDDADDIDYDDLLEDMQKETIETNEARAKLGYDKITLVGWAAKPFYDKEKNTLHWAKELKFGDDGDSTINTLNYNVRILGRKGVLILNAVATMDQLQEVQDNIEKVQGAVAFGDGNKYSDFDPDIDEVAAWTIGGLVAGKVLAKVGFFAIFAKFFKVIALGVVAAATAVWRWIRGRKAEEVVVKNNDQTPPTNPS